MSSNGRAIAVRGLGKSYRIAHQEHHSTLGEAVMSRLRHPLRRPASETIWALRDLSFEAGWGEVVGVIGRNGAGKSTLLKLLARITAPTTGEVRLWGRVGSLLEVGTGFNWELTGRENIFLNGSILGMTRREVRQRFDEIVEFAGVEQFLDTPVKRYSSGMYMRLAFAIAAHLQPEILLVDEVLAVGDADFQKKCLNKMEDVAHEGRTVLFVSHNMQSITRLCGRTVLLDGGRVLFDGPTHEAVRVYLQSGLGSTAVREWPDSAAAPGDEVTRLRAVRVLDEDGGVSEALDIRRPIRVEMEYDVLRPGAVLTPTLDLSNEEGLEIFSLLDIDPEWQGRPRPAGRYRTAVTIPGNLLSEGMHVVDVAIRTQVPYWVHWHERQAVAFQVVDSLEGDSARGGYAGPLGGVIRPRLCWETYVDAGEPVLSGIS